ncbi:MAG: hypothetical protein U1E14_02380 [Geminicoccaceae bacterium]
MDMLKAVAAVRELLADQSRWTREAEARNGFGDPVDPLDDEAERFCISGAFIRIANPEIGSYKTYLRLATQAVRELGGGPQDDLWTFNDRTDTTHDRVMALLDRMAELAAAEDSAQWRRALAEEGIPFAPKPRRPRLN